MDAIFKPRRNRSKLGHRPSDFAPAYWGETKFFTDSARDAKPLGPDDFEDFVPSEAAGTHADEAGTHDDEATGTPEVPPVLGAEVVEPEGVHEIPASISAVILEAEPAQATRHGGKRKGAGRSKKKRGRKRKRDAW